MPPKLTWEVVRAETFDGEKKLRVVIKAQNRGSEKVDFKYIRLGFYANNKGDQPFESRQWFKKGSAAPKTAKPDSAKDGSKIDATGEKTNEEQTHKNDEKKALEDKKEESTAPIATVKPMIIMGWRGGG